MDGVTIQVHYQPSDGTTEVQSTTEYGIQYTGIEGLDVRFAAGDNEDTASVTTENTVMAATYAIDAFTIGMQDNSTDSTTANADNDFRAYGISYAVSEDISISYNVASTDYENTSLEDQDSTGMSFSYTNGSVTLSGSMNEVDNIQGASATDNTGYELNIAFAF
jgi:outer membrane protein OmpU